MRLEYIKLVGFKSFVDPTKVMFPNNRVAVVGPNGCGKSNIIDAIRCVLGERSAKNLRSEDMTDVIFNGSVGRKPVGQASVELVFDNSDGTITGEYAGYQQISVKRQISREGKSQYFLNNSPCRAKDVKNVFLGTGLGPRSYSIIEQGMISRVIDAKPEELRAYLEEAAGISKYKERRRETETRIRHTKENLDRLNDLREEITKQIEKLDRQAKAAEKYQVYKQEERETHAQLIALRYQALQEQLSGLSGDITEKELALDRLTTDLQHTDTQIEKKRLEQVERNDVFNEVQRRFYGLGSEVARFEQSIEHQKERREQLSLDLTQADQDWQMHQQHLQADQAQSETLSTERIELAPQIETTKAEAESSAHELQLVETTLQDWQQQWDTFNQEASTAQQKAQVEQTRIQHLEQRQEQVQTRQDQTQGTLDSLSTTLLEETVLGATQQINEAQRDKATSESELDTVQTTMRTQRETIQSLNVELDEAKVNLQNAKGRESSLKALQQAALGKNQNRVQQWLSNQGLGDNQRLAECLKVDNGWELALETVMGDYLEAVCADDDQQLAGQLSALTQGNVTIVTPPKTSGGGLLSKFRDNQAGSDKLLSKIETELDLGDLIGEIYIADTVEQALSMRSRLSAQASIITRDGVWLGRHWLRVRHTQDERSGVLMREQELKQLAADIESLQGQVNTLQQQLETAKEAVQSSEQQRDTIQKMLNEHNQLLAEKQSELRIAQNKIEQTQQRTQSLQKEFEQLTDDAARLKEEHQEARERWQEALDSLSNHQETREALKTEKASLTERVQAAKLAAQSAKDKAHAVNLKWELLNSQLETSTQNRDRLTQQLESLRERRGSLQENLSSLDTPISELQEQLETALNQRLTVETELTASRASLEEAVQQLTDFEQQRHDQEQQLQNKREAAESARMQRQEFTVRQNTLEEQLQETGQTIDAILPSLPEAANEAEWAETLEKIQNRISRLGAINLAAIEEFKTQSERKEYLDTQNDDLMEALDTLEGAIRKIDKETRERFKETFDKVNASFQDLFPRVFGGGHAYLEMTGEDLLDTGITVMARPPGKRNSTIHLLSGGEKALTAVSLVFAIFHLNPAPFCLLDEVDAPLDDANVGRFCNLLKEMSEKVQFVFITHNKVTMEMADYLMGVTMKEPGVSRLVSVDVAEAVELAEA
ncbi:MAG: chromosome partition protein Smc [marine bacterium B5-7]|nr:MAG: chromosome partition protein Smc [marine bacterium B5-7]